MVWVYAILVDCGSLAAFTFLILHGHPYAAIVPAVVVLTTEIRSGKLER